MRHQDHCDRNVIDPKCSLCLEETVQRAEKKLGPEFWANVRTVPESVVRQAQEAKQINRAFSNPALGQAHDMLSEARWHERPLSVVGDDVQGFVRRIEQVAESEREQTLSTHLQRLGSSMENLGKNLEQCLESLQPVWEALNDLHEFRKEHYNDSTGC